MIKTKFVLLQVVLLLTCCITAVAQQTTETPAWEVTLEAGRTARSNLTVENRCKKSHTFEITLENVPFLKFAALNQVKVSGGKSVDVPVVFDTTGLAPNTGRKYTLLEASDKSDNMCKLLRQLKNKVESQQRTQK